MSISPQPKSNEPSRPVSPAADALEVLSLDDEAISPEEASKMKANNYRKSSSWKGLKNQLSKAEMKIKSTFTEPFTRERKGSVIFYGSAAEGTAVSPTELSPDSVESGPPSPVEHVNGEKDKTEKIADLIKNIEDLGSECDRELQVSKGASSSNDKKDSVVKRVDFVEEPCKKVSMSAIEGAGISRPTDLPFRANEAPVAPPRTKGSKRLERLLSVPNLKLNRQDQNRLLNLRKTSNIVDQKSNKNKGNFIRRFSKYQFQASITHKNVLLICFFNTKTDLFNIFSLLFCASFVALLRKTKKTNFANTTNKKHFVPRTVTHSPRVQFLIDLCCRTLLLNLLTYEIRSEMLSRVTITKADFP